MSDIGVAEIPVDEKERPLPPPEAPASRTVSVGDYARDYLTRIRGGGVGSSFNIVGSSLLRT